MKDYVHPDDQTQPTSFFVARLCSVSRVLRFLPVKFSKQVAWTLQHLILYTAPCPPPSSLSLTVIVIGLCATRMSRSKSAQLWPCYSSGCKTTGLTSNPRSRQSKKIGINLLIDKSIKIGKSDLIDVFDCIDQSVEIDDTLVSFIDLSRFYRFHRFIYRKIHLLFCSSKNEN